MENRAEVAAGNLVFSKEVKLREATLADYLWHEGGGDACDICGEIDGHSQFCEKWE